MTETRPFFVPGIFSLFQRTPVSTNSLIHQYYFHMVALVCTRIIHNLLELARANRLPKTITGPGPTPEDAERHAYSGVPRPEGGDPKRHGIVPGSWSGARRRRTSSRKRLGDPGAHGKLNRAIGTIPFLDRARARKGVPKTWPHFDIPLLRNSESCKCSGPLLGIIGSPVMRTLPLCLRLSNRKKRFL